MANDDSKITEEVSTAYQALEKEVPPARLDELILQAARRDLKQPQVAKTVFHYRRYSIAASICLCVLIASIFVNNKFPVPNSGNVSNSVSTPVRSKAESSEAIEARSEPVLESVSFADESAEALDEAETDTNVSTDTLFQSEEDNDTAAGQELEEIIITGARIARDDLPATAAQLVIDYRSDVELWLLEIQSLLALDDPAAQEEINLFIQAYPDIDLDSALNELEQ